MLDRALGLVQLQSQWRLSADELRALQDRKLRALIRHAYDHVPHYRDLWRAAGLSPGDVQTVDDLPKLPVTTKQELRTAGTDATLANTADLRQSSAFQISRDRTISDMAHLGLLRAFHTGGTTGRPFVIYVSPEERAVRRLIETRAMGVIGRRFWERTAILGPEVGPSRALHQRLGINATRSISCLAPVAEQIRSLAQWQPHVLWSYPATIHAVLHELDYRLSRIIRPRLFVSSSEAIRPWLRKLIADDLDPEFFNWYGCVEFGRLAFECPAHEGLHVNADHVIVEILDDGRPAAPGRQGRVLVTGLHGYTMPLIRYDMGDSAAWVGQPCSCGSAFPLLADLRGRLYDMLILPSGKLSDPGVPEHIVRCYDWVHQFRTIQLTATRLRVEIVADMGVPSGGPEQVQADLEGHLPEPMQVEVVLVEEFAGTLLHRSTFVSRIPDWERIAGLPE